MSKALPSTTVKLAGGSGAGKLLTVSAPPWVTCGKVSSTSGEGSTTTATPEGTGATTTRSIVTTPAA